MADATIDDVAALRALYPQPRGRAVTKQLAALDKHCRRFIELSPFIVVASGAPGGHLDASPRGGEPGFVKVRDDVTLLIPDSPGNNRLDTMQNIVAAAKVGLLFLVPGIDETLRINGAARLRHDAQALEPFAGLARMPKLVIEVTVAEAYLHCAKALMRSKLWDPTRRVERSVLPSTGEMLRDQCGGDAPAETQAQMIARYTPLL
jgi:PPOX class probable FMN-dependent enzyme